MIRFLSFLLVAILTVHPVLADDEITGKPQVVDGDSLTLDGTLVRIYGMDAPELKQTCVSKKGKTQHCGDLARQMLQTIIHTNPVKCLPRGKDPDGAIVALCYGGPFDIAEQMIGAGWALPVREETEDYVRAETFARARHEGMWRGTFIPPKQWREENPQQ